MGKAAWNAGRDGLPEEFLNVIDEFNAKYGLMKR
jgi:hypothetical protein